VAILDWELSTMHGDPWCDLANLLPMYHLPSTQSTGNSVSSDNNNNNNNIIKADKEQHLVISGLQGQLVDGIPSEIAMVDMYNATYTRKNSSSTSSNNSMNNAIALPCLARKNETTLIQQQQQQQQQARRLPFYMNLLLWKNAVIVQGVAQRSHNGVASSTHADQVAQVWLPRLLELAEQQLEKVLAALSNCNNNSNNNCQGQQVNYDYGKLHTNRL